MSDGGKKDAWYIAKKFLPVTNEIGPNKELIDLVVFNGAANIQKAAQLLEENYPRATVQTCIEHTVALLADCIMQIHTCSLQVCKVGK